MTVKRIFELPAATEVAAGDYVLMSQGGVTKKVDVSLLGLGAPTTPGGTPGTTLAGLTDVSLAGAADGSLLNFDGTKWVPTNTTTNQIYDGGNF